MTTAVMGLSVSVFGWSVDWLYGSILIVLTVIFHVVALGAVREKAIMIYGEGSRYHHPSGFFALVVGATALLATVLHALEVALWSAAYCLVGALPNFRSAMLYSLGAMTTYGSSDLYLEEKWRLMGALEALSGWLLFGLTTAFLFWMIQEVSPARHSRG